jgi:hypothetical protein
MMMTKRNISTNNDTEVRKADGFVTKRFLLSVGANKKVFEFRHELYLKWLKEGRREEPVWEDAIEYLIATHPKTKNL